MQRLPVTPESSTKSSSEAQGVTPATDAVTVNSVRPRKVSKSRNSKRVALSKFKVPLNNRKTNTNIGSMFARTSVPIAT